MNLSCNEVFLDDIVRIQVYKADECRFSIPSTVPCITNFVNPTLPQPVLDCSYGDETYMAREGSITVKQVQRQSGSGYLYIYNVEAVIESGVSDMADIIHNCSHSDNHIIATKTDGSLFLLYGLPGSFSADQSNNVSELSLKLSLSSANNFIRIE